MSCSSIISNVSRHMIDQDDLIHEETEKILLLRFKNCTGNEIILNKEMIVHEDPSDLETAHLTLSIDDEFKN